MNENFISIKVDREERPDVDKVYMNAIYVCIDGTCKMPQTEVNKAIKTITKHLKSH